MTQNTLARVQDVFDAACELPASERKSWIDRECAGDARLAGMVHELLAMHETAGEFLAIPAVELDSAGVARSGTGVESALIGTRFGGYTIERVLGVGGMGMVYVARQERPNRLVALKVIRWGSVSTEIVKRFENEAQVLGRLSHPGIARVYDAGWAAGEDGRRQPYFAMELIHGKPLLQHIKECGASRRENLELFARICDAVDHAHRQGVVHRDLKPANILVEPPTTESSTSGFVPPSSAGGASTLTQFDAASPAHFAQPKILDFGVARVMEVEGNATMHTDAGRVIGTIAYMSPEQVRGESGGVDGRADIYALGVMLYEILSGHLPLEVAGLSLPQAARLIGDEEPSSLGKVNRSLRGDLETIVSKAMEKDPGRRYASAGEVAADLRRHLAERPISAKPASVRYRVTKFVRRHRILVAASVLVLVTLAAGTVGTTIGLLRAIEGRALAEVREGQANISAKKANKATRFLIDMLAFASPGRAKGKAYTVRELLDRSSSRVDEELADEPEIGGMVHRMLGQAYLSLDEHAAGERHLKRALELLLSLGREEGAEEASVRNSLGAISRNRGDNELALVQYRQSLAIYERVHGPRHSETIAALCDVARLRASMGERETGKIMLEDALSRLGPLPSARKASTTIDLARVLDGMGENDKAERLIKSVLPMLRLSVGRQHPDVPTALFLLSKLAEEGGRLDEALQRMKECVEIREAVLEPDHSDLLISRARLGTLMAEQGDVPGGRKLLESVLERRVRRFGGDHNDVATTHNSLANICVKAGEMQSAQTHYSEALRVRELAGGGVASKAIAIDLCNLAWVQGRNGEALEAERNARRGVAMHEQVGTTSESIASAWWVLGEVLLRAGNLPEAEMYTRKAMEHASESARTGTSRLSYTRQLARILVAASRHDEAVVLLTTCLSDYKPENLGTVKSARDAAGDLVNLLQSRGEPEAAEIVRQQWGIKGSK